MNINDYRNQHKKIHEIPFNSANKWQLSIHELVSSFAIDSNEMMNDNDNININNNNNELKIENEVKNNMKMKIKIKLQFYK